MLNEIMQVIRTASKEIQELNSFPDAKNYNDKIKLVNTQTKSKIQEILDKYK